MITDLFGNKLAYVLPEPPKEAPPGYVAIKVKADMMRQHIKAKSARPFSIDKEHQLHFAGIGGNTPDPLYITYRDQLVFLLGRDEAERIIMHLEDGKGDCIALISINNYYTKTKNKCHRKK